jgi:hypothetical protein
MKRAFLYYILVQLLFLACSANSSTAQNIQAEAKIDQQTIRIGDQTKLRLVVHQPVKEHVNFPKLADTVVGKVQVVGAPKIDTLIDQNNRSQETVTQSYTITGFDAGTYNIPSYSFGTAAGVVKTNELTFQVVSVKVDTTKSIYDIKQPLTVTYTFVDWLRDNWYWVALPLVIMAAIAGIIIYFKTRPKKEVVAPVVKNIMPTHVIALNQLKVLKEKKLWQQGEVKQYYIELSDILREYLEKRYVIKTHEKTTDEIFASLRHLDLGQDNKQMLRQILVMADLVKFAREHPLPAENEQVMENAMLFVSKTQQSDQVVEIEGGKG